MNFAGIYAVVNTAKKRVYIGSSSNVKRRIIQHRSYLKTGKAAKRIQSDYDNGDIFAFVELYHMENYDELELRRIEQAYINTLWDTASYNSGVNIKAPRGMAISYDVRKIKLNRKVEPFMHRKAINHLCNVLECQPGDIMEYVPDSQGE